MYTKRKERYNSDKLNPIYDFISLPYLVYLLLGYWVVLLKSQRAIEREVDKNLWKKKTRLSSNTSHSNFGLSGS